jgi:hypothetical protein
LSDAAKATTTQIPKVQTPATMRNNVKEGRFASLLVRHRELADSLAEGFHELWRKAMKSLREIHVDPRGRRA